MKAPKKCVRCGATVQPYQFPPPGQPVLCDPCDVHVQRVNAGWVHKS